MSFFKQYFTLNNFIYGLFAALFLSLFIYFEHFGVTHHAINSLFGLIGFYILIHSNPKILACAGFFIGIFWFYWIALSFRYYDLAWMVPFVIVAVALVYALLFYLIGRLHPLLKISALLLLGYLPLLGFDWMRPEIVFVNSYFGVEKWQFGVVLISLYLARANKSFLLLLLFAIDLSAAKEVKKENITLVSTQIQQDQKWLAHNQKEHVQTVINKTNTAIQKGKDLIVFPESFITSFLNTYPKLLFRLTNLSKDITIVTGSLYLAHNRAKNSAYIFRDGRLKIAHKVVLVPFGEANPLPQFLSDIVNTIFYDGAPDYESAKSFTHFLIDDTKYTCAICYEATDPKLYKQNPKNVIAISNNAWFSPSIQPTLQKLLMAHYVLLEDVTLFHSANKSPSFILKKVQ